MPPSAKMTKPTIPGTQRSQARSGPMTRARTARTPSPSRVLDSGSASGMGAPLAEPCRGRQSRTRHDLHLMRRSRYSGPSSDVLLPRHCGGRHHPRRGRRQAALPAHAGPGEAGGALRRPIPHRRHRAVELRQLGHLQAERAHAVQAGSLMQHLARGWQLAPQMGHYVAPVPPAMNLGPRFFEGSADAVLQNVDVIENERPAHVCVFGADHIYKMDVRQMLAFHIEHEADATVAVIPMPVSEAGGLGIVECDATQRVTRFLEKPPIPPDATGMRLASMGLYIFRAEVLTCSIMDDAERADSTHDFGRDILPSLVDSRLFAYDFSTNSIPGMNEHERGYWRDIGTIDAYWDASQDLVSVSPRFSLYNPEWPVFSAYYPSPPAKVVFSDRERNRVGIATDSMVCEGCIISGGRVNRSI